MTAAFPGNNRAFARNMRAALDLARGKERDLIRIVTIDLTGNLVLMSPVDTGRFKANWFSGLGAVNTGTTEDTDKTGAASINRVASDVARLEIGQTIYITNSLPYAVPLEHGHSKQAPYGMVRVTIASYSAKLAEAVRKVQG